LKKNKAIAPQLRGAYFFTHLQEHFTCLAKFPFMEILRLASGILIFIPVAFIGLCIVARVVTMFKKFRRF
jgi:hypothetical protein